MRMKKLLLVMIIITVACMWHISAVGEKIEPAGFGFYDGLLLVKDDSGHYGMIDNKGNLVYEPKWQRMSYFSDGFSTVSNGELYGFIDKTGTLVSDYQWEYASKFSDGMCAVRKDDLTGYINTSFELVIPYQYPSWTDFHDGIAYVNDGTRKFIDKQGNTVLDLSAYADTGVSFHDGLLSVAKSDIKGNYKYGYIDRKGNTVVDFVWDEANDFSDGVACVYNALEKMYSYLDTEGNVLFSTPLISAQNRDASEGKIIEMGYYDLSDNNKPFSFGFMDYTGKTVIPFEKYKWDQVFPFQEGRAIIFKGSLILGQMIDSGVYGYIDETGKIIVEPKWVQAYDYSEGLAVVWDSKTWYVIDLDGNIVF